MPGESDCAERRLDGFIDRYDPAVAAVARGAIAALRRRLPGANLLVYDSYNALAVGFAAGESATGIVLSVTLYPRWVSLFFTEGAALPDPDGLLRGAGKRMRHIVLDDIAWLGKPAVQALIAAAVARSGRTFEGVGRVIVKSASAKQRTRRPG